MPDYTNLSVSVDWQILKNQRKLKVKEFKNQQVQLDQFKPVLKKRGGLVNRHDDGNEGLLRKKTLVANFAEDDTPSEFPDTRSFNENEQSFKMQKYSQSYDQRNTLLNNYN